MSYEEGKVRESGGESGGGADSGRGLINPLAKLVLGGSPTPPDYGPVFSRKNSLEFHRKYTEYTRCVELSNSGQSVQSPLLPVCVSTASA